jgi:esterase/lipase superfamily enzyme
VAQLARLPQPDVDLSRDAPAVIAAHAAIASNLDAALVLSEQVKVENLIFHNPKGFPPALLEHLTVHVQVLSLMTTALLRRTKLEEWQHLDKTVQQAALEASWAHWNLAVAHVEGNDRPRLVRRFINQVRELT